MIKIRESGELFKNPRIAGIFAYYRSNAFAYQKIKSI